MFKRFLVTLAALLCLSTVAQAGEKITFDEKNTLVLRGEVDGQAVAKLQDAILTFPGQELYLVISSPGGSVLAGAQLAETIRTSGKTVKCVATFAASMAFAILQSCQERYVLDSSIIMQHVMSYGLEGQEPNNWSMAKALHRLNRKMDEQQAKRIGISYKAFRAKVRDDWWLLGDEAVEAGAADATVTATCSAALSKKHTKSTVSFLFWSFDVEYSGCPLISGPVSVKPSEKGPKGEASDREYRSFMEKVDVGAWLMNKYIRKDY